MVSCINLEPSTMFFCHSHAHQLFYHFGLFQWKYAFLDGWLPSKYLQFKKQNIENLLSEDAKIFFKCQKFPGGILSQIGNFHKVLSFDLVMPFSIWLVQNQLKPNILMTNKENWTLNPPKIRDVTQHCFLQGNIVA